MDPGTKSTQIVRFLPGVFSGLAILSGTCYEQGNPQDVRAPGQHMQHAKASSVMIEVGAGELIDKITILKIKLDRMTDPAQLRNVGHELEALNAARERSLPPLGELDRLEAALREVNEALWVIEDDIRACEAARDFGPGFIQLARSVYIKNDKRAALKREINRLCGSTIVEEKSYAAFF
jgi:hypothetical protein